MIHWHVVWAGLAGLVSMFVAGIARAGPADCAPGEGFRIPKGRQLLLLVMLCSAGNLNLIIEGSEWENQGLWPGWVFITVGIQLLAFTGSAMVFREGRSRAMPHRARFVWIWLVALFVVTAALLCARSRLALDPNLSPLAGYWFFGGLVGGIWAGRRHLWKARRPKDRAA